MRRALLIAGLAVVLVLVALAATGGLAAIERLAGEAQRQVQGSMAGAIRALRGGQPGALAALLSVCFGYGVVHAAGPGHGKMLIGAYGIGSRVRFATLAGIALAASLTQAAVAVVLVYAGVGLVGWTRERLTGVADRLLEPMGQAAFAAIGLWLVWRGWRALARRADVHARPKSPTAADLHGRGEGGRDRDGLDLHRHDHTSHDHPSVGDHGPRSRSHAPHVHSADCGHRHGPTLDEIDRVGSVRDAALLVGGIAIRPCTGAIFLLLVTWQMGIGHAGILGAFAIGVGTATVTLAVAGLSVWAREGAFAALPGAGLTRALPLVQMAAGGVIAAVAADLFLRNL